eukprot:9143732-Alexandrium_andersonii.AAC.1
MSASLVGSEMCIRDRPRREFPEPSSPAKKACVAEHQGPAGPPAGGATSCLLYTSDAADDM